MGRKRNKKGAGAKEDVNAAEVAMAKAVRRVQVILREHSEQEIRATLLQCNLNHNVAIDRLLSQQDASNEQGVSTQLPESSTTTTSSILVPTQSATITNGETRSVPISSTEAVPPLSVPSSSSDITNGESKSSSNPSLPVPSSRVLTNVEPKRQDTGMISASGPLMAEVVKPSKQNVTKPPVKADSSLHQKQDATNPVSNSITESDAARDPPRDTRQSIATASPLAPRTPTSMAHAFGTYPIAGPHIIQQAMNRGQVPSGQYGNMINSPYSWRPPSAPIQQRGGGITSNSNSLAHRVNMMNSPYSRLEQNDIYESLNSAFAQYRNLTLSLSATSTLPSSPASAYDFDMSSGNSRFGYEDVSRSHLPSNSSGIFSIGGPTSHGPAFGFDMTSGNAENSRLGYEDNVSRIHLPSNSTATFSIAPSSHVNGSNSRLGYGDYLPSVTPHQGRSPFVWRVQGEDILPPRSQQERDAYFERIRADLASADHVYKRSDPSDQTQQRPRDK